MTSAASSSSNITNPAATYYHDDLLPLIIQMKCRLCLQYIRCRLKAEAENVVARLTRIKTNEGRNLNSLASSLGSIDDVMSITIKDDEEVQRKSCQ